MTGTSYLSRDRHRVSVKGQTQSTCQYVDTNVPATNATTYIIAFPTTGNTKIPPCGAIKVQLNIIDNAPATPEPATQAGST